MATEFYIGVMSGTSLDAVDSVLVQFNRKKINILTHYSKAISTDLKNDILKLCYPETDSINLLGATDVKLGQLFANTCLGLLKKSGFKANKIRAIGCAGQTIRHLPYHNPPFTLQIGDPNIIVAKTDITTITDFRRLDVALGGQGAPLVPAFHRYLFHASKENRCIINIGGIANITFLPSNITKKIIGFDTGPGNTLLDAWCAQNQGYSFDKNGAWAAKGKYHPQLLQALLADPYFKRPFPKSTGREYFNLKWLQAFLQQKNIDPIDVQATLVELTARTITNAIASLNLNKVSLWICGGGAKNLFLMQRLQQLNSGFTVNTTALLGMHPQWIEAAAFAWLAQQTMHKSPGNLPSVTGAKKSGILGGIYSV